MIENKEKIELNVIIGKKELIVTAAGKLFLGEGFGSTSMDAIAKEAGVSKATVYSHFQNKESLFAEVMKLSCREMGSPQFDFSPVADAEITLKACGRIFYEHFFQGVWVSMLRRVVAESSQFPELGQVFWDTGPDKLRECLSTYLADQGRRGVLSLSDSDMAAKHFMGLVIGSGFLPILLGVEKPLTDQKLERHMDQVVSSFLHTFRPQP